MSHPIPTSTSPPTPLRILLLHGFTQSPTLFHAKTRALHKHLLRLFPSPHYALSLHYAPAPHKLPLADIPGYDYQQPPNTNNNNEEEEQEAPEAYGWWRRKDRPESEVPGGVLYEGIERGLDSIAEFIRGEGPFEGVVGFSQGAAAAGMVASLSEGQGRREAFERRSGEKGEGIPFPSGFLAKEGEEGAVEGFVQGPLKFAICYSGFRAPGPLYDAFYEPKIKTPVLHVLGQMDVVVEERRARDLVRACDGGEGRVVIHPGGHFVPSAKPWLDAVGMFIRECVEGKEKTERDEVGVEDMEVPF
ncbi:hypothetical protein ACLMJK_009091 [Lecanora helva]